ncbi:large conductance mechanosensitive channel protein [Propionibacterium sp. oral taxon 192 str. F0372]|uniref:large conductance mechanosensitive channel protein MscL n=1 Tax=Propionibacterium sp. oral taxon 192 TaxID=671222 RepID=UPI000352BB28|nr:MscL family protein [Propionibacterium sp. oral taxon 192]EPH03401.1 large conductance mechanosensitive channel protein [Propionibacterium sp. oral taxon 192 str. F0372]
MQGFKDFIMRGNLIELAVAFIMGAAFKDVVDAFTNIVLSLLSAILGGTPNFNYFAPGGIPVGAFLTQVVSFLLIASVVYFGMVLPYNKLRARFDPPKEEETGPSEAELLTQIRDALVNKQN